MNYKDFYSDLIEGRFTALNSDELGLTEEYPMTWNKEEFEKLMRFSERLRYANEHLQKIASGSGRTVFRIDNEKVLKVAKNTKGLAQNKVETDWSMTQYDITAKTFDIGEDVQNIGPHWLEMELAKKLTRSRFKQVTGINFDDLSWYLDNEDTKKLGMRMGTPLPQKLQYELENHEFVTDLITFLHDYDMGFGDAGRLSSFGEVLRDGKPAVVLVDFGLTTQIFNDYYKVG